MQNNEARVAIFIVGLMGLCACHGLIHHDSLALHDVPSLLDPKIRRSEIIGFLAGFGTTFAAVPDLVAMLRRRSSAGMTPRMALISGAFQILWIYYGLLIVSRPVVAWNIVAVLTNFLSVAAYCHFVRRERANGKV